MNGQEESDVLFKLVSKSTVSDRLSEDRLCLTDYE